MEKYSREERGKLANYLRQFKWLSLFWEITN